MTSQHEHAQNARLRKNYFRPRIVDITSSILKSLMWKGITLLFWSRGKEGKAGVGFAVSNRLAAHGITPTPVNDSLMLLRIALANGEYLTLVSVYAPSMERTSEEKESFYEKLCSCIAPAQNDLLIILGDFNACVWRDCKSWLNVIDKHGVGKMNSNSVILLEFCTRLQLSIMGTMSQLKDSLRNIWHQLDHVVANQPAKPFINVTKINQGADCFTDHKLLVEGEVERTHKEPEGKEFYLPHKALVCERAESHGEEWLLF